LLLALASAWDERINRSRKVSEIRGKINPGMHKSNVLRVIGKPEKY